MNKYKYLIPEYEKTLRYHFEKMTHKQLKDLAQVNSVTAYSFPDNQDIQGYCDDLHHLILEYMYPEK